MRDQWVGDIGDFGKYLLLKEICDPTNHLLPRLGLAVVSCYNHSFREIPEEYRPLNQHLFDTLQEISGRISSSALLQQADVLPTNLFHDDPWTRLTRNQRLDWFDEAIALAGNAKVIFIDPDTGIATQTQHKKDAQKHGPTTKRSPEHVYIDELQRFVAARKSLIIYQHRDHTALNRQIESLANRLRGGNLNTELSVLLWEDRLFIPIWYPEHEEFHDNWQAFLQGPLTANGHFAEVPIPNAHPAHNWP